MPSRSAGPRTSSIRGRRAAPRVAVVEAVHVGEQDQRAGPGDVGDQGGQPVVVAEPDLVGGHRVVLVDDRDDAQLEQPVQGPLGVAVVGPAHQVVGGQQDLAGAEAVPGEGRGVPGDEQALADAGRGLLGGQVAGRCGSGPSGTSPDAMAPEETSTTWMPGRTRRGQGGGQGGDAPRRRSRRRAVVSDEEPTLTTIRAAAAMARPRGRPRRPPARCRGRCGHAQSLGIGASAGPAAVAGRGTRCSSGRPGPSRRRPRRLSSPIRTSAPGSAPASASASSTPSRASRSAR